MNGGSKLSLDEADPYCPGTAAARPLCRALGSAVVVLCGPHRGGAHLLPRIRGHRRGLRLRIFRARRIRRGTLGVADRRRKPADPDVAGVIGPLPFAAPGRFGQIAAAYGASSARRSLHIRVPALLRVVALSQSVLAAVRTGAA